MSELDATKPGNVDWGHLTELFRETDKPIRKDENVFYEFSSAMFANFKHILAEREQLRAKLEAAQRLRDAVKPFVKIVTASSGRIPHERLSAANWHELCKASAAFNKDTE